MCLSDGSVLDSRHRPRILYYFVVTKELGFHAVFGFIQLYGSIGQSCRQKFKRFRISYTEYIQCSFSGNDLNLAFNCIKRLQQDNATSMANLRPTRNGYVAIQSVTFRFFSIVRRRSHFDSVSTKISFIELISFLINFVHSFIGYVVIFKRIRMYVPPQIYRQ